MVLVIGGAYQGKLDYIFENYPVKSVFHCDIDKPELDFTANVVDALHLMVLAQIHAGRDAPAYLRERLHDLEDKIVICDDISSGVVPVDAEMRRSREETGRCLALLSRHADEVVRVYCGIGSSIK